MIRRRYGTSFSRARQYEEDINPNEYVANIADCMLVLLLGVIVALVSYYNVDLAQSTETLEDNIGVKLEGAETIQLDEDGDGAVDGNYEQRGGAGTLYYDEATDTYYLKNGKGA